MIKFFRHIRLRLLTQASTDEVRQRPLTENPPLNSQIRAGKMSKYLLYAIGEIVLVVIGILLALQINNWNTQRLNNDRNQDLLLKLSTELDLNIERAAVLDSLWEGGFVHRWRYTDSLNTLLDNNMLASHIDYFVKHPIFYVNTFNLNTSVFEELKNTGSLYAIGSDSLVTEIQRYYQLCDRESFYNLNYSENTIALKQKCNEGFRDFKYLYRRDPEQAVIHHPWISETRSPQYIHFRQFVSSARNHSRLMSKKLKGIIRESEKLKELIAIEIKPLEQD